MNRYVNKKYVGSALEYELNHLGVSNKAVAEMNARLADSRWQPDFTIQDEQWVGPDKLNLWAHIVSGPGGELQISSYDISFKGIQYTFDREGLFWPTVKQAQNLLGGSPVGRSIISPVDGNAAVEWFRLDKDWERVTGNYRIEALGFFDLQRELELLPIREKHYPNGLLSIYSGLLNGDKPAVFYTHFRELEANLEVNAITQCVDVRNKEGEVFASTTALAIADQVMGRGNYYQINSNNKIMKNKNYSEDNFEYNAIRLRQHGFPDTKFKELKDKMQDGQSRILLEFHSRHFAEPVRVGVEETRFSVSKAAILPDSQFQRTWKAI